MASNFPTSIDTFSNPSGTDKVNNTNAALKHSTQHANANDAIEAIETKLGTGGTTPVNNMLLRGTSSSASAWDTTAPAGTIVGDTDTQTLSNKSLVDNSTFIVDNGDNTKKVMFEVSAVTTATTRTKTLQNNSGTIYETGGTDVAIADGGTGQSTATLGFNALSPLTTKGDIIVRDTTNNIRLPVGSDNLVLAANSAASSGLAWTSASVLAGIKFGGTGADGALAVSSGTTTIDLGNATVFVKNYSSISITGTGKVNFSNPNTNGTLIIIKCSGDCTLTSSEAPMLDASGTGGQGGVGGTTSVAGLTASGTSGSIGKTYGFLKTNFGVAGTDGSNTGAGGAIGTFGFMDGIQSFYQATAKYPKMFLGAGGGGGGSSFAASTGTAVGANGGAGGGCLVLEVAGAINFTTSGGISVAGIAGGNGSTTGTPGSARAGGGGGGGGGSAFVFYGTLTAFSGTINVAGGTGGNLANTNSAGTGGGGGGGSALNAGANATSDTTNGNKTGGNGGNGLAINALNTEF